MGYIFLVREREFVKTSENVFKLGLSRGEKLDESKAFPNGSILQSLISCHNSDKKLNKLLNLFKYKFSERNDLGENYFEGNSEDMIKIISDNIINSENEEKNNEELKKNSKKEKTKSKKDNEKSKKEKSKNKKELKEKTKKHDSNKKKKISKKLNEKNTVNIEIDDEKIERLINKMALKEKTFNVVEEEQKMEIL